MSAVELAASLTAEGARQMVICNACRYCEGFCAVFPAMELRRVFTPRDVTYLANLCFDCRACYYACQYAPPHEFAINVPKAFAELRGETYRQYSWPAILGNLFRNNGRAVALIATFCVVLSLALVLALQPVGTMFTVQLGPGAFYRVVPYLAMVLPASAIAIYGAIVFAIGTLRFWRDTRSSFGELVDFGAFIKATQDAFGLRYLANGGYGCNYPNSAFSQSRRWFHHLVFYGFLLDLASTTVAAIYDHFLHWEAPYDLLSLPVVLGTVGGVMLLIGTAGLLYLKWQSDREPTESSMAKMDLAFLVMLFLTSLTGLLLLALRDTAAMGTLLTVHLGIVAALFLTMPYGKFAHLFYRYAALIRNSVEQTRAEAAGAHH
jgi:citrate/tricarballylate utilization protein